MPAAGGDREPVFAVELRKPHEVVIAYMYVLQEVVKPFPSRFAPLSLADETYP